MKTYYDEEDELEYDAIERDPAYGDIFAKIDKEVDRALKDNPSRNKGLIQRFFE